MSGTIYKITCVPTGRAYIGQTVRGVEKRFGEHTKPSSPCIALSRAVAKYGRKSFQIEVLETVAIADLDAAERKWIAALGTMAPSGFNLMTGGARDPSRIYGCVRGHHLPASTREAIRESNRRREFGESSRALIAAANARRVQSPETRAKISAARRLSAQAPTCKHPERRHKARGLCPSCYKAKLRNGGSQ